MPRNQIHDPKVWLSETNQEFGIFQYSYQFSLKDKIYVSTIQDKSIIDNCIQSATLKHNDYLAGDIQKEFKVVSTSVIGQVEHELKWHVSNIFNNSVSKIDLDDDLWVNYQKATEYNPIHSHIGQFSFVIYADISESIREEHKKSIGNAETRGLIQFNSQLTNDIMLFNPSKYTILIFESSHLHQVYPFYSNETRISIAGNIASVQ
jgi:hypothetical protein